MSIHGGVDQQQHLARLAPFFRHLACRLEESLPNPSPLRETWHALVSGECTQCGIRISGEDFCALVKDDAAGKAAPKLERLKKGYCARDGCKSYYYTIRFQSAPGVDWPGLLAAAEPELNSASVPDQPVSESVVECARPAGNWRRPMLVALVIGGFALLLGFRQWYRGGTIPFLREPEHFQVDRYALPEEP